MQKCGFDPKKIAGFSSIKKITIQYIQKSYIEKSSVLLMVPSKQQKWGKILNCDL